MDLRLENWDVSELHVSDPQADRRKDGGDGIGTDQKPEQMVVDEQGQREKREFSVCHSYCFLDRLSDNAQSFKTKSPSSYRHVIAECSQAHRNVCCNEKLSRVGFSHVRLSPDSTLE